MLLTHTNIFRLLIVIGSCLYLFLIVTPYFDVLLLSEEEKNAFTYLGFKAVIVIPEFIIWGLVFLWFISAFGMFVYFSWARVLFAIWVIISVLSTLVGGLQVNTHIDAFLSYFGNLVDGAILIMAYTSDIRTKFGK